MYLGYNQLYSCDDYNVDRGYDDDSDAMMIVMMIVMMITVMKDDNNDDAIILKINDINDGNYVDVYDEDCDDANYDDTDYDDVVRCHSAAYRECSSYEHYGPTVVAELSEWIVGELNGSNSYLIEEVFYHHHYFF